MKRFAKLNILLLILTFFASCYKPIEFINVEEAKINVGKGANEFVLHMNLYNPNFYTVKIVHSDLKVSVNNTNIGDITSDDVFELKGKDTTLTDFKMNLNVMDILGGIGNIFKSQDSEIRIKGYITAKTLFGKKIIEIDQKRKM